ncbi:MAG: GAF domain-containing protein, partial [Deltaproteobacteria bacterium]|nr:GAF domain-containing protein [Deltaproteobacteria bacterium]
MKFNIRIKLIAFTFCIILLVGGSISLYFIYQGRQRILETFKEDALQTTTLLSGTLINDLYFLDISSLRHRLRNARVNPDISHTYVMDSEGILLTDGTGQNPMGGQKLTDNLTRELLQSKGWVSQVEDEMFKVGLPLVTSDGVRIGHLQVGFSLDNAYRIVHVTTRASLYITLACLIIGAALAFVVATGFSRPIESIVKAALAIGQGRLDTRLPAERKDELGVLARSINQMAESLQSRRAEAKRLFNETQHVLLEKIDLFLPYSTATVRLLNKESSLLEPVACRNLDEAEWKVAAWKPGRGPANAVFESKTPLVIRNCLNDPRVKDHEFFRKHQLVSYLGVPMFAKEEILGVLSFYTKEKHEFTAEEVEFLTTLAGQATIAIHNSQLYQEMVKLAADLSRSNKVKDEFLSVMSHELRTPLNVVMGYTGMIRDGLLGEINPEQEKALGKVISRARDQLTMISSILQATQLEAEGIKVERGEVSLGDLLDDLRSGYAIPLGKDLSLIWDYPSDLPVINTDGEKL